MYVSRKPLNTGRSILSTTANNNGPVDWTPGRIKGVGQFLAAAGWLTAPVRAAEALEGPTRPVQAGAPVAAGVDGGIDSDGADEGLGGLLAAIADEVQSRVAAVVAGLSGEFAARIAHARKTLPKDQAAAAVAALKQARKVAVKAVRENAAGEIKGRQKAAMVLRRRGKIRQINKELRPDL